MATRSSAVAVAGYPLGDQHVAHVAADAIQYSQEESGSKEVMQP